MQQAIGDVGQVMQPIAQIGVGLTLQLGPGVVVDPLNRSLRGQAGTHRLAQPAQPAAIVSDHAEGLEHVAVLAAKAVVVAVDQTVDRSAHSVDRRLEPHELRFYVIGDNRGHSHPRLVHHHMAEAQSFGNAETLQRHLPAHGDRRALGGYQLQLPGRDHLGEQHGGRLQRLDFLFRVGAPRAVLHDQHSDRRAPAQNRHAEERLVDLFTRLRSVGKGRMMLRVGQRQRLGARSDKADKTLAWPHGGQVDRLAVEALGGE